jgi:hypothetical protein
MARITKSLVPLEHGYVHREHRSKKGRVKGYRNKRLKRTARKKKLEVIPEIELE